MTREPEVCKSYTIYADGGSLTLSETDDRLAIEVTISRPTDTLVAERRIVSLTRAQFKALCDMGSSYDGLAVEDAPEPEEEEPEEERDVIPA